MRIMMSSLYSANTRQNASVRTMVRFVRSDESGGGGRGRSEGVRWGGEGVVASFAFEHSPPIKDSDTMTNYSHIYLSVFN